MAVQTTVTFVDDIDGSTAGVEHYTFNWLGTDYEIDLAPKSAKKLVDVMNTYTARSARVPKARAGGGDRGSRAAARTRTSRDAIAEMRAWAVEQGMRVSDRGRISQAVKDAYHQAH